MLHFSNHRLPDGIFLNGFVTVKGSKMSKRRGTFMTARGYLNAELNPEWLRYYYATRLRGTTKDIDIKLDDLRAKTNAEVIGKYLGIASRCAGLIHSHCNGKIGPSDTAIVQRITPITLGTTIGEHYQAREIAQAMQLIMLAAQQTHHYIEQQKPWELAKHGKNQALHRVCSTALTIFRTLSILIKPVLPNLVEKVEVFLQSQPLTWDDLHQPIPIGTTIQPYQHLMERVEPSQITQLEKSNQAVLAATPSLHPQRPNTSQTTPALSH
jgi:methionyl-tRNA synthetase